MGKQKSFIIVGITFLSVIIILLLIPFFTKFFKETSCSFEANEYTMIVGEERALAPNIYASGKVDYSDFEFEVEDENIIDLKTGTYSKGSNEVHCWMFVEYDTNGEKITQKSKIPYNESDEITVQNGNWFINGVDTKLKALKEYTEEDIEFCSQSSTEEADKITSQCYILNGVQTTIPYIENVEPVRDEESGNWFVNGRDTGYTYKGIQVTVTAKAVGQSKITLVGNIAGKEYIVSTTIKVICPDPDRIVLNETYENSIKFVNKGEKFSFDYTVYAAEGAEGEPLQTVEYTISDAKAADSSSSKSPISQTNGEFSADEYGIAKVRLTANGNPSQKDKKSVTVYVVVLPEGTSQDDITKLHEAIEKLEVFNKDVATTIRTSSLEKALEARATIKEYLDSYNAVPESLRFAVYNASTMLDKHNIVENKITQFQNENN